MPDHVTGAKDRVAWKGTNNGSFSVKSAYRLLTSVVSPRQNMERFYQRIWTVVAPERVRCFLWLAGQQVIMTNCERYRRHLGATNTCEVCKGAPETVLHVLRDCPAMEGIWNRVVPMGKRQTFFTQSLLQWLFTNLGDNQMVGESTWSTFFCSNGMVGVEMEVRKFFWGHPIVQGQSKICQGESNRGDQSNMRPRRSETCTATRGEKNMVESSTR